MGYTTHALKTCASAAAGEALWLGLLNSSAVECTGSGYARQQPTYAPSASGTASGYVSMSGTVSFEVVSFTVSTIAAYDGSGSANLIATDDIDTPVTFTATGGTFTVDSAVHSFS